MDKNVQSLLSFLDNAHSVYHAAAYIADILTANGYQPLHESAAWELRPGGKYYVVRNGSAVLAFRVPENTPTGFLISASHSDRPTFKVKEHGELVSAYTRLAVERYGGMIIAPWLDRPLSVAGRVLVETEDGIETRLIDIDRDLLLIPNVAIHMNRKANEGYAWNPAVDTIPLMGTKEASGKFWALVEEAAGGKVFGHDLYLYIRQKGCCWGVDQEFISSAALDDLECAWGCTQGFLNSTETDSIPVLCVFDNEEVGSSSLQGAGSDFMQSALLRICAALGVSEKQMYAQSFLVSADNAHALHPNHPEYADSANAPMINQGVVLKFNANQRYTTDGVSAAIFRKLCAKADVPVQTYCNRADMVGGSTLGNVSLGQVAVHSVDIGLAQLAMHSCYETAGVKDVGYLEQVMTVFYSSTYLHQQDGMYILQC